MNEWKFIKNFNRHNSYRDIKNKWAPTATDRVGLDVLKFVVLVIMFLFLGCGTGFMLINEWLQPSLPRSPGAYKDLIQPIIHKYEEKPTHSYINFASEINNAKVLLNETSTFYHGWIVSYM